MNIMKINNGHINKSFYIIVLFIYSLLLTYGVVHLYLENKSEKKEHLIVETELVKEISNLTNTGLQAIADKSELEITEFDEHAEHRVTQYDENHSTKLDEYNENDSIKMEEYNNNHVQRLENLNYAYADRIVDLINTKKLLGVIDQFTAQEPTEYAKFLDTTDPEYLYYLNGVKLVETIDYSIFDNKTIKLVQRM